MEKTFAVLARGGAVAFVSAKLAEFEARRSALKARIQHVAEQRQELLSRAERYRGSKDQIRELVTKLQGPNTQELFQLRAQIAAQLKVLISGVWIGSLGIRPRHPAAIERLRVERQRHQTLVAYARITGAAQPPKQTDRYFTAECRDSSVRCVFPDPDDPLKFIEQVIGSDDRDFDIVRPGEPTSATVFVPLIRQ